MIFRFLALNRVEAADFYLPKLELYLIVGLEKIGGLTSLTYRSRTLPNIVYIRVSHITDKNKTFARKLETTITKNLNKIESIKFLTPESTRDDIEYIK